MIFLLFLYFYTGSSWELVLYQRYPATASGGDGADPTEVNIEISESVVKSILSDDTQQEHNSETDIARVNIDDKGSRRQIRNVLFHTDDQFEKNKNPYLEPESLTMYDELGDRHCLIRYANFGPNTIAEFF